MTVCHLLRAIEARVLSDGSADSSEKDMIRKDCTARIGELATLAMKFEKPTTIGINNTLLTADPPRSSSSILSNFSLRTPNATASNIMSLWMSRGTDASTMLAHLLKGK